MALVESKALVEAWASAWPGVTPAAVSALDVLVGDVLEEEEGARPDGPLVVLEERGGAERRAGSPPGGQTADQGGIDPTPRVDVEAISRWTLSGAGALERILGVRRKSLRRRLERDIALAAERIGAWRRAEEALGEIPWTAIAPMEVVSLAMGHFGPARQPVALPVISSYLVATAALFSDGVRPAAVRSAEQYEPVFAGIARTSSRAIEELGRRAKVPDPFGLPIPAYLPLL